MTVNPPREIQQLPVHQFDTKVQLTSYEVSTDALEQIEQYLLGDLQAVLAISPEHLATNYSVEIEDSLGTETFSSITHFRPQQFTNSTKAINVRLRYSINFSSREQVKSFKSLTVTLRFETRDARFAVDCESTTPREIVSGIFDAITRLLEPHKTVNWIFHPHMVVTDGFLPMLVAPGLMVATGLLLKHDLPSLAFASGTLVVGVYLYLSVGRMTHPYTTFDSRRNKTFTKLVEWFFLGLLTFLLFGTLLPKLRQQIFGF